MGFLTAVDLRTGRRSLERDTTGEQWRLVAREALLVSYLYWTWEASKLLDEPSDRQWLFVALLRDDRDFVDLRAQPRFTVGSSSLGGLDESESEGHLENIRDLGLGALAHANRLAAYAATENSRAPDLSVLQAAHAAELFIKARIAQERPLLVFELLSLSSCL